jgi:PAS domain-containing protein
MSDGLQGVSEASTQGGTGDRLFPLPSTRQEVEVILARQLAGYLALPMVIVDPTSVVVYYNEPAEQVLGRRFDEGAAVPQHELPEVFGFTDDSGERILATEMALATTLRTRRVAHRTFWMVGRDGVKHHIDSTAIPLIGNAGRFLGAVGIFSEIES